MALRSITTIEEEHIVNSRSIGELMSLAAQAKSLPIIWQLAKHRSTAVRGMLYDNPNTPEPVILYLQRLHVRDSTSHALARVRKFADSRRVLDEMVLSYKGINSQRVQFTKTDTEALAWIFHLNETELEYIIELVHGRKDYVYSPTVASALMCDVRLTNDVKEDIMQHYKRYNISKERIFHGVFVSTYEMNDIITEGALSLSDVPYDQIILNDKLMSEYAEINPHRMITDSWMLPKKAANAAYFSKKATPFLLDHFLPGKKEPRTQARPIDHISGSWQDMHPSHFAVVYEMGLLKKYDVALERLILLHPKTKPDIFIDLINRLNVDETYWALYNTSLLEPIYKTALEALQNQGHKTVRDEAAALAGYKEEIDEILLNDASNPLPETEMIIETSVQVTDNANPMLMLMPHQRYQLADSLDTAQETLLFLYETFDDCRDRVKNNPMFNM